MSTGQKKLVFMWELDVLSGLEFDDGDELRQAINKEIDHLLGSGVFSGAVYTFSYHYEHP